MTVDLDELRRIVTAAKAWHPDWIEPGTLRDIANSLVAEDTAHIVACSPTTVLALLDEVERLREELGHATADDGDWLSKQSRRMCETVMLDRDAERQRVRDRDAIIAEQAARIAELEAGLREALDAWDAWDPDFAHPRIAVLRALAGGGR